MGKVEYQNSIIANLLSGFYEQVELENKDESHRAIFQRLREEFEFEIKLLCEIVELEKSEHSYGASWELIDKIEDRLKEMKQ